MEVQFLHTPSSQSQSASYRSPEGDSCGLVGSGKHEVRLQSIGDSGQAFRVLIVDRDSMSSDLLAAALSRDRNCHATGIGSAELLEHMADGKTLRGRHRSRS